MDIGMLMFDATIYLMLFPIFILFNVILIKVARVFFTSIMEMFS